MNGRGGGDASPPSGRGRAVLTPLGLLVIALAAMLAGLFVWNRAEGGEMLGLVLALGLASCALLVPRFNSTAPRQGPASSDPVEEDPARSGPALSGWARAVLYLVGLVVLLYSAFGLGTWFFEVTECSGPDFDGECDLAGLGGLAWDVVALGLAVVAIILNEVRLRRRSRR